MGITVEVELHEFEEGDIIEYLQDLGYTVTKEEEVPDKNVVEFLPEDVLRLKNVSREEREQITLETTLYQLNLEHLL